jgi:actin-related protein 9
MPGGQLQQHHVSSPHYGQTPTSIKVPKVPDFFSAFKDAGVDEVVFLGAQCAAKVLFFTEAKKDEMKSFMPRADYNEFGPQAIHNYRY